MVTAFTALPSAAPDWMLERNSLWSAVEGAEKRSDANTAREIVVALPHELSAEERERLVRALAEHLVERFGVAVDAAIHEPSAEGDDRNHHAHLLMTTRRVGRDGLGAKTRELNDRKTGPAAIRELRAWWADRSNAALAEAKQSARVDHRSHAARRAALEADASEADAETARLERPGVVMWVATRERTRRERAETARSRAEDARALAAAIGEPTEHLGPAGTAKRRMEARLEAEVDAERQREALERENAEAALRDQEEHKAALRASQEALRAEERIREARAWVRATLKAGDEALAPPGLEAFIERCEVEVIDMPTVLAWSEEHEGWFEGLRERFERERPAFEPMWPAPGIPAPMARARTVQAAARALFETPAWREHAAQAVTHSAVHSVTHKQPAPAFEAFREAVERAVQRLRARLEALRPKPEAKPAPAPEPRRCPRPTGGRGARDPPGGVSPRPCRPGPG